MKTRTKFFLTSACLIFMEQSAYVMHMEKEREISPARFKIQELNQKNDDMKALGSSSRWLEEGKIAFLPSKNLLPNEHSYAAHVPDRNLASQAMDNMYTEVLPRNIVAYITTFLDLTQLGRAVRISSFCKTVFDVPAVWRIIRLRDYASYLTKDNLKENPKEEIRVHKMLKKAMIRAQERRELGENEEREIVQLHHNTTSKFSTSWYKNFWFLTK